MKQSPLAAEAGAPAPVLILAPGRDGELSCRVLGAAGRLCTRCRDEADLRAHLDDDTGALLLAEEAITAGLAGWLHAHVLQQPPWSDLPIVVVAQEAGHAHDHARLAALGNVTVLTRPMAMADLTSTVASTLRARARQFQVRQLLRQQREEARRKDEFLAMLAHELRNPLAPVRYAAQALRAEQGSPRVAQLTGVVERQVAHMGRIIAQLLDVSRLTQGKIRLERGLLDLAELARRCVEAHADEAAARGIALQAQASGSAWVDGDETRLSQVVENLLDNAMKFSAAGNTVRLVVQARDGWAELAVVDEGDGIPPQDLPFVFQPFVQADRTLDRARGGLGLGLAMVKGLTELHGGHVDVRSDGPGLGSRFTVLLPLARPPEPARPEAAAGSAPLRRRLHVLLAEDNEDAAETLRMLLEFTGYEVTVAHSGPAAVEAARARAPDVLLCDIGLPGISGYEVARTLRGDPALAGMLMIAITGYGTGDDRAAAAAAGFDRHFAKPVDPQQLFTELERVAG